MKIIIISFIVSIISFHSNASSIIAKKIFPSTIAIVAEDSNGQQLSLGSGFMIQDDIAVTNYHVIEGASSGYIKFINQEGIYEIMGVTAFNPKFDLWSKFTDDWFKQEVKLLIDKALKLQQ